MQEKINITLVIRYSESYKSDSLFISTKKFLSFAKNMIKNISKSITKNLSNKYSQRIIDNVKQSTTDAVKLLQKGKFIKEQKELVTLLVIKPLIRLQKSQ